MKNGFFKAIVACTALTLCVSACSKHSAAEILLEVSPTTFKEFPAEGGSDSFTIKSSESWSVSCDNWIKVNPAKGNAGEHGIRVNFTVTGNSSDAAREGRITVKSAGKSSEIKVAQAKNIPSPTTSLAGKKFVIIGNSMLYYGGFVQKGSQGPNDPGMFSKILKEHHGNDINVCDYTFGDHQLNDFITVCRHDGSCKGDDHLAGLDFKTADYVLISQAGNNNSSFYNDASAVFNRFKSANPKVKMYYVNHIYSVYKNHQNVLGNLKKLHDDLGVTIINCGQLAYDIYTGKVKIPGGTLSYSDKYTFVNHTSSDTHHPNPLMGYIMTQMAYCAVSGSEASGQDYLTMLTTSKFGDGSVAFSSYYSKYYTTAAAVPFTSVINNKAEMAGIQSLIPQYIDKY